MSYKLGHGQIFLMRNPLVVAWAFHPVVFLTHRWKSKFHVLMLQICFWLFTASVPPKQLFDGKQGINNIICPNNGPAASRLLEIEFKASVGQLPNTQWVIMPSFKLTLGALQPSKKRTWFGGNSFCLSSHELWCNRHKWLVYIHTFDPGPWSNLA